MKVTIFRIVGWGAIAAAAIDFVIAIVLLCTSPTPVSTNRNLMICPDCHNTVSIHAAQCPHCGRAVGQVRAPMAPMATPARVNTDDSAYCGECGTKLFSRLQRCPTCAERAAREAAGLPPEPVADPNADWTCGRCGNVNIPAFRTCTQCGHRKDV